jgi:carbon-monoxide dehydrogenase iron sulfur subunit
LKRIFIEREKCEACFTCMVVCLNVHRKEPGNIDDLPLFSDIESRNYTTYAGGYSTSVICRHCDDPECVATCMSGALQKNPKSKLVSYNKERCGKCFMCVMCCPYGLPRPDNATRSEVIRCNFCKGIAGGPSCVAFCPTNTITIMEVDY